MPHHTLLFDCDNTFGLPLKEIDDGLTLLYLLGRADVDLLGITTVFGNGTLEEVLDATRQQLQGLGRTDLPVLAGAGTRGAAPTEAARFLAETAAARPGEITLLATGPLSNLHAAAQLDSGFFGNLKAIACMGGYRHDLRLGWRTLPELNLSADPQASYSVLNAACPVTLMDAHVCLQAPFGLRDLRRARFWDRATRRTVRNWLLTFGLYCGVTVFYLWDLLPAVYITHPDLFEARTERVASSEDDLATGSLVRIEDEAAPPVVMPARILDPTRFKDVLFEAWENV